MDVLRLLEPANVGVFLLVAARVTAAMVVGPLAALPGVPLPVRILSSLAIALALTPTIASRLPSGTLRFGAGEILQEVLLGLLVGVASALLVSALQLAAGLLDFQTGFTFGASFDPLTSHQTGPIERFFGVLAAATFLEMNGHHLFLLSLGELFRIVPVGTAPYLVGPDGLAAFFTAIVVAAVLMALPIITLLLLVDVALAVLTRAAPQFNLFAVGLPARALMAMVAIALLLPVTAIQLGYLFGHLPEVIPTLIRH